MSLRPTAVASGDLSARLDPFTREIIQSCLGAVCDEMFTALRKTAMSTVIYEILDFGVAITTAEGEMACSGAGLPTFVALLGPTVADLSRKFGNQITPGDVFVTNELFSGGGSHLNDVCLAKPVFADGRCVAWVANKAHWSDIGGSQPGSISTAATEVYQEGLQIPNIRLFDGGQLVQSVVDLIAANSRVPKATMGDMWAAISALNVGEKRLAELVHKYGAAALETSMLDYISKGEEAARRALEQLPRGAFTAEDFTEEGEAITVQVIVSETQFIVDLMENPKQQAGPFNATRAVSEAGAQIVFQAATAPHGICNAGSFKPLVLKTRPGTIFDAQRPAACGLYVDPIMYVMDLIWKALAAAVPHRLGAGHYNSVCGTIIAGTHPETGSFRVAVEPQVGGYGACATQDGENALIVMCDGETFNAPIEVNEARNGLFVQRYALNTADGGEGQFRGGKGIILEYRVRSADASITAVFNRSRQAPWGLRGGRGGSTNYCEVIRTSGGTERHARINGLRLQRGDVLRIVTGAGGGYGDPRQRCREAVLGDLKNGYITPQQVLTYYEGSG